MEKVHTAASGFAGQVRDPAAALVLDGRLGDDIVHHGVGRSAVRAVAAIPFREKARDVVLDGFEKQRRIKARGPRNALDL